ncbi:amino acid ABC transporter substrate-binding protein [Pyrobaculum calidifontis]|uniref:Amino acid/amide ABC transporter substrate-binding protein, HAAT family n=1 Tax=Pyrobaculum calidifontis (strain DSM 21063 / JCM 11548 / VA1) TaxID=410359 RepID=A3MUF7_PYRCJ|nr:amino acid ABC transporter substrate-binding protein [Pyrobaculum calidifontis]ABO08274.1 amino acid/amide ABC transporter substrate-binding protein, HAAT family [Pyrobaculum calidifontis JCM 11548]
MQTKNLVIITTIIVVIIAIGIASWLLTPQQPAPVTPTTAKPTTTTQPATTPAQTTTTQATSSPSPSAKCPDEIVIGTAMPISGRYAAEGQYSLWGALAVVNWINDQGGLDCGGKKVRVRLVYRDSESKLELAQSITESLITQDKVNFLLSPYGSDLALGVSSIAEKYGVLMAVVGASSDRIFQQGFKYVLGVAAVASQYMVPVLDMIKQRDPTVKTVAILYRDSEFNRQVAEGAKAYAEKLGLQVVVYEVYPSSPKDLTPQILKVKQANPDVIIVASHFADGQLAVQQLAEQKVNAKAIALSVAPLVPEFYTSLKSLAECILGPSHWEPGVRYTPELAKQRGVEWFGPTREEFITYFKKVAKEMSGKEVDPGYHAAWAAEGVLALLYGVYKAQSASSNDVLKALQNARFMTFFSEFKLDPATNLNVAHSMVVTQWQNGTRVVVWPSAVAEGKLAYPSLTWEAKLGGAVCK